VDVLNCASSRRFTGNFLRKPAPGGRHDGQLQAEKEKATDGEKAGNAGTPRRKVRSSRQPATKRVADTT
jgi:hypothetical protein